MGALLVLNPAFSRTDPKKFLGGQLMNGPNGLRKVVRVWSDNFNISNGSAFPLSGAHGGMIHLFGALKKYRGTVSDKTVVLTWSRGGEIVDKLLREKGQGLIDAGVDPATVEMWLCGDPEAKYTGACYLNPVTDPPVYPGNKPHNLFCPTPAQFHGGHGAGFGIPNPMVWKPKITYVMQEFDGHADAPATTNAEVAKYFTAGNLFCPSRRTPGPHDNYRTPIDHPLNIKRTDPAQTHVDYMWLRSYPTPSLAKSTESPNWIRNEYERIYPLIIGCHSNRQVTLPMLDTSAIASVVA